LRAFWSTLSLLPRRGRQRVFWEQGTGTTRTLTIIRAAGLTGTAAITIAVGDGIDTASSGLALTGLGFYADDLAHLAPPSPAAHALQLADAQGVDLFSQQADLLFRGRFGLAYVRRNL